MPGWTPGGRQRLTAERPPRCGVARSPRRRCCPPGPCRLQTRTFELLEPGNALQTPPTANHGQHSSRRRHHCLPAPPYAPPGDRGHALARRQLGGVGLVPARLSNMGPSSCSGSLLRHLRLLPCSACSSVRRVLGAHAIWPSPPRSAAVRRSRRTTALRRSAVRRRPAACPAASRRAPRLPRPLLWPPYRPERPRRTAVGLRDRRLATAEAPPPGDVRVDHHPLHVGLGVVGPADPGPARTGGRQRVLDGVLGQRLVAGQHVGEPQQRVGLLGRPRLEVDRAGRDPRLRLAAKAASIPSGRRSDPRSLQSPAGPGSPSRCRSGRRDSPARSASAAASRHRGSCRRRTMPTPPGASRTSQRSSILCSSGLPMWIAGFDQIWSNTHVLRYVVRQRRVHPLGDPGRLGVLRGQLQRPGVHVDRPDLTASGPPPPGRTRSARSRCPGRG